MWHHVFRNMQVLPCLVTDGISVLYSIPGDIHSTYLRSLLCAFMGLCLMTMLEPSFRPSTYNQWTCLAMCAADIFADGTPSFAGAPLDYSRTETLGAVSFLCLDFPCSSLRDRLVGTLSSMQPSFAVQVARWAMSQDIWHHHITEHT
jgi:hypothetical protein